MEKVKKTIIEVSAIFIISLLFVIIIDEIFYINLGTVNMPNIKSILISTFLIFACLLIFTGLFNNLNITVTMFAIITFLFSIINVVKIHYTENPILFTDFNFLSNSKELFGLIDSNLIQVLTEKIFIIIILLIMLITVVLISVLISKLLINEKQKSKTRIGKIISGLAILIVAFLPNPVIKNFMMSNFYDTEATSKFLMVCPNIKYYTKYGVVASMYGQMLENRIMKPENYNEEILDELLESTNQGSGAWGKPNIIIVFSEAFWDMSKIEEVEFNKELTANFNKLKKEGIYINLISPTYGGLSANVDFELLTGGSLRYFGFGYVPLQEIYDKKQNSSITSLVNELNNNGYVTKIVFGKDYYKAENEFKKIGFRHYVEVEKTEENTKGMFVSDEYLTDLIINELENKEEQRILYMSETIQNHMPFWREKYNNYDINIEKSIYSDDINQTLLSYAQGIYDADKQLGRLYKYIQDYNEPTVILFFGDHLPYLNTRTRSKCNITIRIF